jgi:PII-like signaling protein
MKVEREALQVTVYVNSTDQWHGRPLYAAIVQTCQEHHIAGATVTRCQEGYGAGQQLHTTRVLELSENLPMRIDIIDLVERLDPLMPTLGSMIGEGLMVVQKVQVLRFLPDPQLTPGDI